MNQAKPDDARKPGEAAVSPWKHLVQRSHPWRQQLCVKGRNLTARQLVGSMKANRMTEEETAQNHHLPVDAVLEAIAYVEKNLELIQTEAEIERLMHKRHQLTHASQTVS